MGIFCLIFSSINAQHFTELTSNTTGYKFPTLQHKDSTIAFKANVFLQIKHLKHLPEDFKAHPFEDAEKAQFQFQDWEERNEHSQIAAVNLIGTYKGKQFEDTEYFDLRTGDHFELDDLFTDNSQRGYEAPLSDYITELIENKQLPESKRITIEVHLEQDSLGIIVRKATAPIFRLAYSTLEAYLSDYGKGLLLPQTEVVVNRPDPVNKLFLATEQIDTASTYKSFYTPMYILILKSGSGITVYRWNRKSSYASSYTEASLKDGVIQADDYVWDSLEQKKVHVMYALHLEQQENDSWSGHIQTGSPVYYIQLKEL